MSHSEFGGSVIIVEMRKERTSQCLQIGNLGLDVTEQDVANHIFNYGEIKIPPKTINLRPGRSNHQTAVIVFETKKDADQTMRKLNGSKLKGREIFVNRDSYTGKKKKRLLEIAEQKFKLKKKSNDKLKSRKSKAQKKFEKKKQKQFANMRRYKRNAYTLTPREKAYMDENYN